MKLVIRSAIVLIAVAALGGCVYGPGYGYVRSDGYNGDAYYGNSYSYPPYDNGYSGYYPGYYGYGPSFGLDLSYGGYGHGRFGHRDYYNHGRDNWSHGRGDRSGHRGHAARHSGGQRGSRSGY
ncbi:MAG: hypothetical protein ABI748_11550 [Dokdonella sp.]